eukprot:gene19314-25177_t
MELGDTSNSKKPLWVDIDYGIVPLFKLMRYTLQSNVNNKTWNYKREQLTNYINDFASVNPDYVGQKHRYVYSQASPDFYTSCPLKGLLKVDIETRTDQAWFGEIYEFLGEPLFIKKKNQEQADEDDGYIISILLNTKDMISEFVIFDAKDITKGPISRTKLPVTIPFGLHGSFAPGLTFDPNELLSRWKANIAIESKSWNQMSGGFSGLGLSNGLF